jgi:hypothetical protein
MWEIFQPWQLFENCLTVPVGKLVEELPNRMGPDDTAFHRFLLSAFFARAILTTSA